VIVPFLPVASSIEDVKWQQAVEEENNLPIGALEAAGWIKPANQRSPEQRVVHRIFHFTDPAAANTTLHDGIYIGKEKLHPCKDKCEPVCCVRCQLWGHVTRECKALKDICGTCRKNHWMDCCNAY
jgi:hypothetical protein